MDGELRLPQVVDEGVGDLAEQPRVLVGGADLAPSQRQTLLSDRPCDKLHRGPKYSKSVIFTTQHTCNNIMVHKDNIYTVHTILLLKGKYVFYFIFYPSYLLYQGMV